jgi:hypothetical protein
LSIINPFLCIPTVMRDSCSAGDVNLNDLADQLMVNDAKHSNNPPIAKKIARKKASNNSLQVVESAGQAALQTLVYIGIHPQLSSNHHHLSN